MAATDVQIERPEKRRPLSWFPAVLAGVVLTLVAIGVTVWVVAGLGLIQLSSLLHGGAIHINVDQPTVVQRIQALQRLETVSYTMDKIVSGERENPILPQFLAGDRLPSVITSKAANGYQFKTGQRRVPGT